MILLFHYSPEKFRVFSFGIACDEAEAEPATAKQR